MLVFLPEVFSKFVGKHESEPRDALSISLWKPPTVVRPSYEFEDFEFSAQTGLVSSHF